MEESLEMERSKAAVHYATLSVACFLRGETKMRSVPEVIDTSGGCGASFAIEIVSEQFEGKRLLERHRLVNSALEEQMKNIHALSIKKAVTPAQWQQQAESNKSQPAT
ncbi:protein BOLA2-like [Magnolia sinica]|uniref:protein BOLA2-like n=1 Tax=Magnolia sinica TaxID=86752 RepID=UPI00265A7191|nr:protein BOLA2-like [Magnolia sinica]